MSCPDANGILAFIDGCLPADNRSGVAAHLDSCAPCFTLVAALVEPQSTEKEPPPARSARTRLPKGTSIGRYIILDLVGRGGMSAVYSAHDPKLDRRVAIKLLSERSPSPVSAARLSREAQAIARLSHPNVVSIYDAGDFDERVFLVMEFVDGQTLSEWLRSTPRTWREIRDVFLSCGAGLAAAHEAGLVHRDFKPQNAMVGRDGSVRVTDFGLVTNSSELDRSDAIPFEPEDAGLESSQRALALTRSGVLLGTPLYMAPEQFLRRPTDARTDQFSFCVSLYEALYGERPFPSDSLSNLFEAVIRGRLREPAKKTRAPSFIRKVLRRGLSVEPASRFPSMRALLDALRYDQVLRRRQLAIGVVATAAIAVATVVGGQRLSMRGRRMGPIGGDKLAGVLDLGEGGRRSALAGHRSPATRQ